MEMTTIGDEATMAPLECGCDDPNPPRRAPNVHPGNHIPSVWSYTYLVEGRIQYGADECLISMEIPVQ